MDQIIITYQIIQTSCYPSGIPGLYSHAPKEGDSTRPAYPGMVQSCNEKFFESATEFFLQLEMSATRILA